MIKIILNSRIHLSLISMYDSPYRVNGGIGFAIEKPSCNLLIKPASKNQFKVDPLSSDLSLLSSPIASLLDSICTKERLSTRIEITIEGNFPMHTGFGSGTAIRLACIEALYLLNNRCYTNELIISLSGRGGTSGVGIHTYFEGGFIFDLGHSSRSDSSLRPSYIGKRKKPPLLLGHYPMPNWKLGICIPKIPPLSHKEEREFFKKNCPLPDKEIYKITYHSLFGVLGAILDRDYQAFCCSINNLQKTAWKSLERSLHGEILLQTEKILRKSGADAVGMSSLGPGLYFCSNDVKNIIRNLDDSKFTIFESSIVNKGREVSYV